ncbi:MAG: prepilin-type N-terminal cleavage/methylation domain-containing protein [Planctomycetes bacterium]|nr:prepilin-type N-terminal cleavage/methylation domain-containing protein [Planctomycetota bacterium]
MTTRPTRVRGFTLIEVLAATALFAVLGTMLFQMMSGATEIWTRGERVRDMEEQAGAALDLLTDDLRHVWCGVPGEGEQDSRFLCEFREFDHDGDGLDDARTTTLRFTRLLHESRSVPWLRHAGERPASDGVATLTGEEDPAELQPTGGLAESLYTVVTVPGEPLPSLIRKVRTPPGGPDSLLAPELHEERLLDESVRLVDRVLFFGVACWTPDTRDWDAAPLEGGPSFVWDSTRGILPPDSGFAYAEGPGSLLDGHDDLWPTVVRVTLVLDPYQGSAVAPGTLADDVTAQATALRLRKALSGDDRQPSHVWVEGEWMDVVSVSGRDLVVRRRALPRDHAAGAQVRTGFSFTREVLLPSVRENLDR